MSSFYPPGRVIGTRYRIVSALSQGGMGAVYLAQQISLGRDVALKVILEREHDPELAKRFDVEARAVCLLKHPNIITYHDYGRDEEGRPYLVMEFLAGYPGTKLVYGERRASLRDVIHVVAQMCSALHEAHSKRIIHRDLKWSNVMIVPQSHDPFFAKLIDFGIIKVATSDGSTGSGKEKALTVTGVLIGTPEYMSPEAICGMPIDGRADQYSLGIMLWEALEGVRPFGAATQFELLRQQVQEEPPPFVAARPIIDQYPQLEAVVLKAIEKHPDDRFDSILDLRDHLLASVGLAPERSGPLPQLAPAAPAPREGAATRPKTAQPVPRSQRGLSAPPLEVPPLDTGHRTGRNAPGELAPAAPRTRTGLLVGVALAMLAAGAAVTAIVVSGSRGADSGAGAAADTEVAVASAVDATPTAETTPAPTALAIVTKAAPDAAGATASAPDTSPPPAADTAVAPADTAVAVEADTAPPLADVVEERDVTAVAVVDAPSTKRPDAAAAVTGQGELRISSSKPAEIFIGGVSYGSTPKTLTLKAGKYTVALKYSYLSGPGERQLHNVRVPPNGEAHISAIAPPRPQ